MNPREKMLLIGSNMWYLGEGLFGPLFAVFTQRVGGNILEITWAWSLYLIITGTLTIVVGKISDQKHWKARLMVLGYGLNALLTFAYLWVDSVDKLFIVQAGLGVAMALSAPTWSALYSQFEDKGKEGWEWGLVSGQYRIITGIAILIGGLIVTYYSFDTLFWLMGAIQVVATLYMARILRYNKA